MKKKETKLTEEEKIVKRFKNYEDIVEVIEAILLFAIIGTIIFVTSELFKCNFNIILVKDSLLQFIGYDGVQVELIFILEVVAKIISITVLIESLRRMMRDTYKHKTPFVKQNITRMNIIAICSIFYSKQIIYFIIVVAVKELFKYGYKLQTESDETL